MRRYAPVMGGKAADDKARELLFTTTREREAHTGAMQALLAHNTSLRTNDELITEQLRLDPEFRAEWERTALDAPPPLQRFTTAPSTTSRSRNWLAYSA